MVAVSVLSVVVAVSVLSVVVVVSVLSVVVGVSVLSVVVLSVVVVAGCDYSKWSSLDNVIS